MQHVWAAVAAAGAACGASAATIHTVNDLSGRTAWEAMLQAGSLVTETFDGQTVSRYGAPQSGLPGDAGSYLPGDNVGGVNSFAAAFGTVSTPNTMYLEDGANTNDVTPANGTKYLSLYKSGSSFTIEFDDTSRFNSFAFEYFDLEISDIEVTYFDPVDGGEVSGPGAIIQGSNQQFGFFGITGQGAANGYLQSITFTIAGGNEGVSFDNISVGYVVPLPSAGAAGLAGLGLLAARRRR